MRLHLYEVEVGVQVPLDSPQVALEKASWDHAVDRAVNKILQKFSKYPEISPINIMKTFANFRWQVCDSYIKT